MPSTRAEVVTRRTYNRPIKHGSDILETFEQTLIRVIGHQRWLWERALTHMQFPDIKLKDVKEDNSSWIKLNDEQEQELAELYQLMLSRKMLPSGRTLWLGGTDVAKSREASQFNCSFLNIETVYDVVDSFWLLLQGCGVGFSPIVGTLTGFKKPIPEIEVIRSIRTGKGGFEDNIETFAEGVWTIKLGDSAEAWAKSLGKLMAGKYNADKLVFDFSEVRPSGERLAGYGWISSGDGPISKAYPAIANIMNRRAGNILRKIDILDLLNHMGTVLSSRRSAEIALVEYGSDEWIEFASSKEQCYTDGYKHRQQSNNSLVFNNKPTYEQLSKVFDMMVEHGGSEPGFINGQTAKARAPWFKGVNPSLRKGTKVYTTEGIKNIEDLQDREDFYVYTLDKEISRAACKLSGKNQPLYKITLEGGHTTYSTKEHKWPIYRKGYNTGRDKWSSIFKVDTCDILSGDCFDFPKRDSLFPEGTKGSYSEGRLLGWLQGDGWITTRGDNGKHQIGFIVSNKEEEMIPLIVDAIRPYSKANFISRGNTYELNTQNEKLYEYITKDLGYISKEHLPSSIFDANYSEDFRKGFIDGIYSSDGNVEITSTGCKRRICLTSSRASFIKEISELLGFYGIKTSIYNGKTILNGKEYDNNTLRIGSYKSIKHFNKLVELSVYHKYERLVDILKPKRIFLEEKIQVISVELTDIKEDVWDIGVANETHTFQLAYGITGNCAEILLGSKSFCNLVEIDVSKFEGDAAGLHKTATLAARANYRQTVVDFRDGILQESWHLNNEFLRLCGVGTTGIAQRDDMTGYDWKDLKYSAVTSARGMAHELGLQHPKNVTTVK